MVPETKERSLESLEAAFRSGTRLSAANKPTTVGSEGSA
jgi:hypothetical protein